MLTFGKFVSKGTTEFSETKANPWRKLFGQCQEWVYTRKELEHVALEDLNRSWVANSKREEGKRGRGRGRLAGWLAGVLSFCIDFHGRGLPWAFSN